MTIADMSWHPWRHIRSLGNAVEVTWDAEDGELGSWCGASRKMDFNPRQSQRQRRCTATHEIVHRELAHEGPCTEATELVVHKISARRLITIEALVQAALFYGDDEEALAEELWVDLETLQVRKAYLHPAEAGYLKRRLAMRDQTA